MKWVNYNLLTEAISNTKVNSLIIWSKNETNLLIKIMLYIISNIIPLRYQTMFIILAKVNFCKFTQVK